MKVVADHFGPQSTLCQLPWRRKSPIYLLGMPGPPRFDAARGGRADGPTPASAVFRVSGLTPENHLAPVRDQ